MVDVDQKRRQLLLAEEQERRARIEAAMARKIDTPMWDNQAQRGTDWQRRNRWILTIIMIAAVFLAGFFIGRSW